MLLDLLIVVFAVSALYRGRELGFLRQFCSAVGFFAGLFLGAWLEPHIFSHVQGQSSRALVAVSTTLGSALLLLMAGEYIGLKLKHRLLLKRANRFDVELGSVVNVISLLLSAWLLAAVIGALPLPSVQAAINDSRIISTLNKSLPEAPGVIASLGRLIDPNGFPQVFVGNEPAPKGNVDLPSLGELRTAVEKDRASVVKIEGQGCGGIVDGSGFVVGPNLIATNAHVVAGIRQPYVQDGNGTHRSTPIWFDPNLDFAVLQTANLAGEPLHITSTSVPSGTAAVALGYPGGGAFAARVAAVLEEITASGRNIYGRGNTVRDVYEIQADIIPGNSGGPLIAKDGSVIGVIFAQSTSYQHVGYALTTPQVINDIKQAAAANKTVSTGRCTE